jgi:hypothetical protein
MMRLSSIANVRLWVPWIAAVLVIGWYYLTDPDGGWETLLRLQWLVWLVVIAGPVYLLRRALFPNVRSKDAARMAMDNSAQALSV